MELSCTTLTGFSSARILRSPYSFPGKNIKTISHSPTKINFMPTRRSRNYIPNISKFCGIRNISNMSDHAKHSFAKISPGQKTIPLIKATVDETGEVASDSRLSTILRFCDALLLFIKPEILRGTTAAFTGIMLRTWMENAHLVTLPKSTLFVRAMIVFVAVLCIATNGSGVNQIFDIEIDKINKPYYPLASGKMSLRTAWILVTSFITVGMTASMILKSGQLLAFVLSNTFFGMLYSVPPFSTKRSTVGAILTCALMWGTSTTGLSGAARTILGLPFRLSVPTIALATFATLFALVCGALKDIQDMEGDKMFCVPTLASIYGPRNVAFFGFGAMVLTYAGAIPLAMLLPQVFKKKILIPAHIVLALFVIFQAWKLEKANYSKEASQAMYQSMLKLLAIEFVLFPFI